MDLERIAPRELIERGDRSGAAAIDFATCLLGQAGRADDLPALPDLATALLSLASCRLAKVLLPLATVPLELALVRTAEHVSVSLYETGAAPEVIVLDHLVRLVDALAMCATALRELVEDSSAPPTMRAIAERLAARVESAAPEPAPTLAHSEVEREGGQLHEPSDGVPLAFGYRARIPAGHAQPNDAASRADVHALLFTGELFAWARGRRVLLVRGPIVLAIGRMLAAARALVDAWDAGRSANVRLGVGGLAFGVRLDGDVSLTVGNERTGHVTIPALEVPEVVLPNPPSRVRRASRVAGGRPLAVAQPPRASATRRGEEPPPTREVSAP